MPCREVLQLVELSKRAAGAMPWPAVRRQSFRGPAGVVIVRRGCDLVLYYKYLLVLNGDREYALHFNETDALSAAQRRYVESQYALFRQWYAQWSAGATPGLILPFMTGRRAARRRHRYISCIRKSHDIDGRHAHRRADHCRKP